MTVTNFSITGGGRLREVVARRELTVHVSKVKPHLHKHYAIDIIFHNLKHKASLDVFFVVVLQIRVERKMRRLEKCSSKIQVESSRECFMPAEL